MKTLLAFSLQLFLGLLLDPFSRCPPPFIAIPFLFQLSFSQLDLRGYLSYQHISLPFLDYKDRLLRVFPLFRPIIQHSIWLTLDEKNEGDCYIGLCILLHVFLGKEGEKGCIRLSKRPLLNGTTFLMDYLDNDGTMFPWEDGFYGLP